MKHTFALLVILFFFVATSYNQAEPINPKANQNFPKDWYIPQEVLDYYYFKKGTYWVYENDKTGEVDSVVVSVAQKMMTNATQQGERYEVAYTDAVSILDGFTYKYGLSMQGSAGCIKDGSKWPCYGISCNKYKIGNVLGESQSLFLPFEQNYGGVADFSAQSSLIKMLREHDSVSVGINTFFAIKVVSITKALVANRKHTNFYWAKNVGIIKKENLTDAENWNLIRYHIVK